jgi:tRNA nucleotidyltransferase (CCA-adding enzyme)
MRTPEDWDITTSANPEQVKAIFPRTVDTGIQHGTVTVLADKVGYEVTTYRIDGEYEDGRHPKSVEFTRNLTEDLRRRDFTINAMAYSDRDGLVDIFEGQKDLQLGIIRCVGNAQDRFTEDALRILRAIRFSAQLGFDIEEETRKAIAVIAPNMLKVSRERIQVELTKLLLSNHPEKIVEVYESRIASYICEPFHETLKTISGVEGLKLLPVNKHMRWAGLLRHQLPEVSVRILRELKYLLISLLSGK